MLVAVTSIVKWGIFVQGKKRGVEQDGVVVLHNDPLVLCLDPWLVLIGWMEQREDRRGFGLNGAIRMKPKPLFLNTQLW